MTIFARIYRILSLFLLGLMISPPRSFAVPQVPHAVVCEALMVSLKKMDGTEKLAPRMSLRNLRENLRRSYNFTNGMSLGEQNLYQALNYFDSFQQPRGDAQQVRKVLVHLQQLERDLLDNSLDSTRVGVEIRGVQNMTKFFAALDREFSDLNESVKTGLDRRFPWWRMGNLQQIPIQVFTWAYFTWKMDFNNDPMNSGFYLGAALLASYVTNRIFGKADPKTLQPGFSEQLALARQCAEGQCPPSPVSIVSGNLWIGTDYHRELMVTDSERRPDLDSTVRNSSASRITGGDAQWMIGRSLLDRRSPEEEAQRKMALEVRFPDGVYRKVFYDSIFYMDPQTGEPVWVISYRAFKSDPPQRPPKKPTEETAEENWSPASLIPGLVPVRAR